MSNEGGSGAGQSSEPDREGISRELAIQLYKMEYEQCVSSYHNIYQEIWKIFSYLTAISAAVLIFGREYFSPGIALAVSMLPLIFWFLGVYLPMDRYGNMRVDRLAAIEKRLDDDYGVSLSHFIAMRGKACWPLIHPKFGVGWRVRRAVWVLGVFVVLIFAGGLGHAIYTGQMSKAKQPASFQGAVEIKSPLQIELRNVVAAPPSAHSASK